jgi:hypothetical protein
MTERTWFETIKIESGQLAEQIGRLIHEGNVRRIVIRQRETVIVEFPLTIGVVGAMIAPIAAAIGAVAALLTDCSIEVERGEPAPPAVEEPEAPAKADTVDEVFELMER